jgi:hypothetical protein
MFPYQRAAIGMTPQFIPWGCEICTWTCCDTGHSLLCLASCRYESCQISRYAEAQAQQPGDPVEALRALRNQLEAQIAAVEAQERVLKEQRDRQRGGAAP